MPRRNMVKIQQLCCVGPFAKKTNSCEIVIGPKLDLTYDKVFIWKADREACAIAQTHNMSAIACTMLSS